MSEHYPLHLVISVCSCWTTRPGVCATNFMRKIVSLSHAKIEILNKF